MWLPYTYTLENTVMTGLTGEQRVSIAGTVTNGVSGDVMPGAQVRITRAPVAFAARLMTTVAQTIAPHPHLRASYDHLFQHRSITADSLKTAQVILDSLSRSQLFQGGRPDATTTGGDGHYCFFNLPPGDYGVTAAISMLDHRYGVSHRSVQVEAAGNSLVFSQLDIEIDISQMLPQAQLSVPRVPASDPDGARGATTPVADLVQALMRVGRN
jgi:hypothetical protein